MSAKQPIVLQEGTQSAVTLHPSRQGPDFQEYENRSAVAYVGREKVTLSLRRPGATTRGQSDSRNVKVAVHVETPVMETLGNSDSGLTPAPTVAYRPLVDIVFTFPVRHAGADRTRNYEYALDVLQDAQVVDLITNLAMPG